MDQACTSHLSVYLLTMKPHQFGDWSEWRSETGHLTLSSLPTILAYLPRGQGIINITQEPALSFFKSFPWKCSTPLNGPANAVAVMFWTAALLQDKLCSARSLSADFLAQRLRGCERQPVMARWKSLINFFTSWCWLLLKCHLPSFHPQPPYPSLHALSPWSHPHLSSMPPDGQGMSEIGWSHTPD